MQDRQAAPADAVNRAEADPVKVLGSLGMVSIAVLGASFVLAHTALHGPVCLIRYEYHVPCPGCGITRSLDACWHGDVLTAFRYHPLGIPLFLGCWIMALLYVVSRLTAGLRPLIFRPVQLLNSSRFQWGLLVVFLGVWLMRLGLARAGSSFFMW